MKIFFIPNYFYLNLPVFNAIINRISPEDKECYILRVPGNTKIEYDSRFNESYFDEKGLNFLCCPILTNENYKHGILNKLMFIINSYKNKNTIRNLLFKEKPSSIVIGSDTGNLNVRNLVDECNLLNIPIVIIYHCDIPELIKPTSIFNWVNRLYQKVSNNKNFLGLARALSYNGNIPGEYSENSIVCVISEQAKQKLIRQNIEEKRIIVTGLELVHDTLEDLGIVKNIKENICSSFNISYNHKIIAWFSPCLQEIYSTDYAINFYNEVKKVLDLLPDDIHFVIKLHPREDKNIMNNILEIFSNERYHITHHFDVETLLLGADLSLSHFSQVLINAALKSKRFLSFNWEQERNKTFILSDEAEVVEISSCEETNTKILKALSDEEYIKMLDKTINIISNRFRNDNGLNEICKIILGK